MFIKVSQNNFLFLICLINSLLFSSLSRATTYYSDASGGDPNNVNLWWTNTGGTGSHPADFTSSFDIFNIKAGHIYTTTNVWNIGGTLKVYGSLTVQTANTIKVLTIISGGVVNAFAQTTITASASGGQFNINNGGHYIFNHTKTNNSTTLFAGTESFGTMSIVEFQSFETTTGAFAYCLDQSSSNFGNVIWNIQTGNTAYNLNYSSSTNRTIAGNFTISKTGASGNLAWCNNSNVAKLTVTGNYIQTDGDFLIQRSEIGSDGCTFEVQGDFILSTGSFDLGGSGSYDGILNLEGDFTMNSGIFYYSYNSSSGSAAVNFTGSSSQTFTYSSGTWTTTYIPFTINAGATVILASNMNIANSLTVSNNGTLNIPNPYFVIGEGITTIANGATLKTGHVEGISTTVSKGCIQTTSSTFNSGASLEFNGLSPQETGNAFNTIANLTLNNSTNIEFTQDLTISNGGRFTLTKGYHNLNGYTLTLGTSAVENFLVYTAGGLYAKDNVGSFKRWIPSTTITTSSGNYYGLFPFAKSAGQLGIVKITSTTNVLGGYITISPTFGYDTGISCSVADGAYTIYRIQGGSFFTVTANTITAGSSIMLEYDCGIYLSASGATASDLCLATYTSGTVSKIGTHTVNVGSETSPQVIRTLTNMNLIVAGVVCVLGSHDASNTLILQCNLGGTKTVGPTGDYSRLTDALSAISASGLNSSLILELQTSYTSSSEQFPLKIDPFNCLGSSNTILIRPATGATGLTISKSNATAVVSFNQGDYVTIDGRPGSTGTTSQLTISNKGTSGPAILFTAGASYNCVKYVTIEGGQSGVSHGTVEFTTYSTTANNYDTITNCTIQNYIGNNQANAIYSSGDGATKKNTSNFICSNKFIDFISSGVFLDTYNDSWTINGNHFYQTAAITPSATIYGIHMVNDGSGYTISNNYIGGQASNCGGSAYTLNASANHYFPIYLSITGTSTATSIQGNVVRNITFSNTDGSSSNPGIFTGIYVSGLNSVNIGTVSGNIVGDTTASASTDISITSSKSGGLIQGIAVNSSGNTYIQNNLIGDFKTSNVSTKGYTFYGIRTFGSGACSITANKIGSCNSANSIQIGGALTGTGVCAFYGIHNAVTGQSIIQANYIENCSVYGSAGSKIYGIYNTDGSTNITISSNNIGNLSTAYFGGSNTSAMCVGIYQDACVTTSITSNTIHTCTINNGFFKGIYLNNTSGNSTVTSNTIGTSTIGDIVITSLSKCSDFTTNVTANHSGIAVGESTPNCSLTSNIVRSIVCSGELTYVVGGIVIGNTAAPIVTLSSNTIEKIGCANTGGYSSDVYGVYSGSTSTTSITHKKNTIRHLYNCNTTSPEIFGYYDIAYNHSFINNFISVKNTDGTNSYTNSIDLYGLWLNASSVGKTTYIYYNTVEIGGSQAGGNNLSYTVYQNSSVATTLIYKNNLLQNARTGSSGKQYVYYGSSSTPTSTHSYNYLVAPSLTDFAYVGVNLSSAQFLVVADDYGNSTSTATITAHTIGVDGSIIDISALTPGEDLHLTTDCTEDINGTEGNRGGVSTMVHMGCYEGPVTTFYSADATSNAVAGVLTNWNSKTDASGVSPTNFTNAGYIFVVQSGHKYQVMSNWTGNATGFIKIDSGGSLDLNAQTLSVWGSIRINGTGLSSSGALLNTSKSASSCSIPINLQAASSIVSFGSGGVTFTGNVTNAGFMLTVDGSYATTISTAVISGTGGITKEGSGKLTLTGTNTYTGATLISAGVVNIQNATGFGTTAGGVIIASGAAVELQGGINVGAEALSLNNTGVSSAGALRNVNGNNSWAGAITLTSNAVRINSDTGILTLSGGIINGSINLTIGGAGNVTSNGVIGSGSGNLTKDGAGTLTVGATNSYTGTTTVSAGSIVLDAAQTSLKNDLVLTAGTFNARGYAITTSGNWTNNGGTFIHGNNTVNLIGSSKTIGGSSSTTFYNLTLNGATALGVATTVTDTMSLGSHLTLGVYDLIIGSSGIFLGYSDTTFVVTDSIGKVTQNSLGSGSVLGKQVFPVGHSASSTVYTPIIINNTGTTRDISVCIGHGRLASGTTGSASTSHAIDKTWNVSSSGPGYSVTLTVQWDVSRELSNFTRSNSYIGHHNGSSWDTGITSSAATNVSGTIYTQTRSGITSFSPFSVEDPSALPIKLIEFKVKQTGNKVRLDWETGTEDNNDFFTVERSYDGKNFENVFSKVGAGNSKTNLYYFGYDNYPLNGISYYRLKQTDFDGQYTYSEIESVNFEEELVREFSVYPNPLVEDKLTIRFTSFENDEMTIQLFNMVGQILFVDVFLAQKGKNNHSIQLPQLTKGMYMIKFGNEQIGYEIINVNR